MTSPDFKAYMDDAVEEVRNGNDVETNKLMSAVGIGLQDVANRLNADPTNDDLIGRLRVALLALGDASQFEVIEEAAIVGRTMSTPVQSASQGIPSVGDLTSGFVPQFQVQQPAQQAPAPQPVQQQPTVVTPVPTAPQGKKKNPPRPRAPRQ